MDWLTDPQAWIAFATLTALEIVLGVDNVVFISILAGKLPVEQRERARRWGLGLAMLHEWRDRTFHSAADIAACCAVPVLATLVKMAPNDRPTT